MTKKLSECPYCKRPADEHGGINHVGGCTGLQDIPMNRLQYDILRGNLSLAEEGLANYALEIERKNSLIDAQDEAQTSLHAENVRLRVENEQLQSRLEGSQAAAAVGEREVERLQMSLKRYEPVSLYNGHDIDWWKAEAERLKAALRLLDNGFKHSTEVCNIARGALAQSSHEQRRISERDYTDAAMHAGLPPPTKRDIQAMNAVIDALYKDRQGASNAHEPNSCASLPEGK